jgi:AraC-like DNA-binding protein
MVEVHSPPPVISQASHLAAVYVPPACAEWPGIVGRKMLIQIPAGGVPRVAITPPRRDPVAPSVLFEDQLILALEPSVLRADRGIFAAQVTCDPYLYGIASSLRCGFREGCIPPEGYLESLASAIAEHFDRYYPVRLRRRESHGLSADRLALVLALVEERLHEHVAVEEMASAVHMSPYHFARMFRRSTQMSPHAYLTRRRIQRASELLGMTALTVREIATSVGYRNQAHFSRAFQVAMGTAPRSYRAQNRRRPRNAS